MYSELLAKGVDVLFDDRQDVRPGVKFNDSDPVSYTHLRAHETVLDLVCRLLLEKKKYDKTQDIICSR